MYYNINGILIYENIFSFFLLDVIIGSFYYFFPGIRTNLKSKIRQYLKGWIYMNIAINFILDKKFVQEDYEMSKELLSSQKMFVRSINTICTYGLGVGIEYLTSFFIN